MTSENSQHPRAIVWAVDPFESGPSIDPQAARWLAGWARTHDYAIQPVYVLTHASRMIAGLSDQERDLLIVRARDLVASQFKDLGITEAKPAKVVAGESASKVGRMTEILEMAERFHSPWIVVSSHGRSGLSKLTFGSFAESLLLQSKHPVLFLSHARKHHDGERFDRLLFPTDFSMGSHAAFRRVLEHAKAVHLEIILFYSNTIPAAVMTAPEVPISLPAGYLEEHEQEARTSADAWIEEARRIGVGVQFLMRAGGNPFALGAAVLQAAKDQHAGLISMACTSGEFASFIAGSVSRDVFREGEFPVLMYGPRTVTANDFPESPRA